MIKNIEMNKILILKNSIDLSNEDLKRYIKFHTHLSKSKKKMLYFGFVFISLSLFISIVFNIIYFLILSGLVIFLFGLSYRMLINDIKRYAKKIKGTKSRIMRLTKELELEKSYPRTKMIRLLAPYHSFKAEMIDDKVIIKEMIDKKMTVVAEKTIDEVINDFKKQIGDFKILRAQICLRIDYPGKDNFKWFELENLLK